MLKHSYHVKSRVSIKAKATTPMHQEDHSASTPVLQKQFCVTLYSTFTYNLPSGPWPTISNIVK